MDWVIILFILFIPVIKLSRRNRGYKKVHDISILGEKEYPVMETLKPTMLSKGRWKVVGILVM